MDTSSYYYCSLLYDSRSSVCTDLVSTMMRSEILQGYPRIGEIRFASFFPIQSEFFQLFNIISSRILLINISLLVVSRIFFQLNLCLNILPNF